jgi:hypothetical protein
VGGARRRANCGQERREFTSRHFEAVLRLEFPGGGHSWLAEHPGGVGLNYGYVLFTVRRP